MGLDDDYLVPSDEGLLYWFLAQLGSSGNWVEVKGQDAVVNTMNNLPPKIYDDIVATRTTQPRGDL